MVCFHPAAQFPLQTSFSLLVPSYRSFQFMCPWAGSAASQICSCRSDVWLLKQRSAGSPGPAKYQKRKGKPYSPSGMTGVPWESQMLTLPSFPSGRVSQYILQSLDKSQYMKVLLEVVGKGFQFLDSCQVLPTTGNPMVTAPSDWISERSPQQSAAFWILLADLKVIRSLKFIMCPGLSIYVASKSLQVSSWQQVHISHLSLTSLISGLKKLVFLPFHTVRGVLKTRIPKWFTFPFSSRPLFCQKSPPTTHCLGWPCTAWLIASLSYTRLWFMWSFSLVFCDCGFHSRGRGAVVLASSLCPLMHEDKRLVQASWWEALAVRKTDAFELWC